MKVKIIFFLLFITLASSVFSQQMFNSNDCKQALEDLSIHVSERKITIDSTTSEFRFYEVSQNVSLTNYKFLKDKKVFRKFLSYGLNQKDYLNTYTVLLGALKSLKNKEEVLINIKNSFTQYKNAIDGCNCNALDQESEYVKLDPKNNFAAFWDCGNLGKIQLRYIYNETLGIYFGELLIENPYQKNSK